MTDTTQNAQVQTLTRVFKMGSLELDDPNPQAEPLDALRLYAKAYPVLANATLDEPSIDGQRMVYEVVKPQGKTKG